MKEAAVYRRPNTAMKTKKKTIRTKILLSIILMAIIPALTLGIGSSITTFKSTYDTAINSLNEIVSVTSERIHYQLESYINVAVCAGANPYYSDPDIPAEEKQETLMNFAVEHGFERGNIIGEDGLSIFNGQDFSERNYFQSAMRGEAFVSDPLLSKITNEYAIIVAAPLWENGIYDSNVIGCIYFAPPANFLTDIMNSIQISEDNGAYMINRQGIIIADKTPETVKSQTSVIEIAKNNPSYQKLANIHTKMIAGETGNDIYSNEGNSCFVSYAPVNSNVDGWFLAIEDPSINYFRSALINIIAIIVIMVVFCIIAIIVAFKISNSIVKPVHACSERIRRLAEGDLSSPAVNCNTEDEVGILAHSTASLVNSLNVIINDIDRILTAMAEGKLDVDTNCNADAYVGDLSSIIESIKRINHDLSISMGRIDDAAIQVSAGSDQVSSAAQSLSQGATEQASSIEALALSINDIASKTESNLVECKAAKETVNNSAQLMGEADNQMQQMTQAMSRINTTSKKIEEIMKTIEDIAFQTNILALNAAVEAARVGAAGKGFAVVADEVSNLAAKSQDAVKHTSVLIEESADMVKEGIEIAGLTAQTLEKAVKYSSEVITIVEKVAQSSETQAESISKVTEGIDQISTVVQTNSATAEESAAASEQLNSQATLMRGLVEQFTLKKK